MVKSRPERGENQPSARPCGENGHGTAKAIVSQTMFLNERSTMRMPKLKPNRSQKSGFMSGHIKRFLSEDVAATAIEYGLIAALVSVGAMGDDGDWHFSGVDFRLRCCAD